MLHLKKAMCIKVYLFTFLLMVASIFSSSCTSKEPTLQAPNNIVLQPYIHYFSMVIQGTTVSPDAADVPFTVPFIPLVFKSENNIEMVFFVENEISGSIQIWKNNKDGKTVFSTEWHFSDKTGKLWSNLMRPPNTSLRENRIQLGRFEVGYYVLNIMLANGTKVDVSFKVTD